MNDVKHIPRMRLAREALAELKQLDPNTGITLYYLRRLAKSGEVKCVHAGKKILMNFDELLDYLYNSNPQKGNTTT